MLRATGTTLSKQAPVSHCTHQCSCCWSPVPLVQSISACIILQPVCILVACIVTEVWMVKQFQDYIERFIEASSLFKVTMQSSSSGDTVATHDREKRISSLVKVPASQPNFNSGLESWKCIENTIQFLLHNQTQLLVNITNHLLFSIHHGKQKQHSIMILHNLFSLITGTLLQHKYPNRLGLVFGN